MSRLQKLKVVREYTRLYAARFGFVSHPHPRGALNPKLCATNRLADVRAATLFLMDGFRMPSLMTFPKMA